MIKKAGIFYRLFFRLNFFPEFFRVDYFKWFLARKILIIKIAQLPGMFKG